MGSIGNWGRWGPEDEHGTWNLLTPEVVKHGVGLVQSGVVVSLAQPAGAAAAVSPHRRQPARFMDRDAGDYALGARSPDGFRFAEDTVQFPTHSGTHLDALAHTWEGDTLYNNHPSSSMRSTQGAQRCGADKLRPMVTRGVLLDLVALNGAPLEPSTAVGTDMLEAAYRAGGIRPRSGDCVLLRTGWYERGQSLPEYHADEPGISIGAAEWLAANEAAVVGADNYAVEVQPSDGGTFPVHLCLLHRHGTPLIENLDLAELARHDRAEFLLVLAPLPLVGSTASPLTPVAVL
jgi:kynurenine formamidase